MGASGWSSSGDFVFDEESNCMAECHTPDDAAMLVRLIDERAEFKKRVEELERFSPAMPSLQWEQVVSAHGGNSSDLFRSEGYADARMEHMAQNPRWTK